MKKPKKACKNSAEFVVAVARNDRHWVCSEHLGPEVSQRIGKAKYGVVVNRDCSEYAPCCYEQLPLTDEERELYDLMNSAGRALKAAIRADRKAKGRGP